MLIIVFLLSTGLAAGAIALEYVTLDASFVWLWLPAAVIAAGSAAIGIPRIGGRGNYEPSEKAVAAALAVVLFLVLFVVTAVQLRYVERKVHYR